MNRSRTRSVVVSITVIVLLALVASDVWLIRRRAHFTREIERLQASMTDLERQRAAQIISQEENKVRLALVLLRRQAHLTPELHVSVAIDSSMMYLERDGVALREMPILIGPERRIGITPDTVHLAPPRGARTVAQVLTENDSWEVPAWVYADRGMPAPSPDDRVLRAALGPVAVILDGGTVIYSLPPAGPLGDSAYVLPGAVRARADDLRAIVPNLKAGTNVYFY